MSIDLYVYEPPGPSSPDEAIEYLERDEERLMADVEPEQPRPGPLLAQFVAEAERRWPLQPEGVDGPWHSWPLYSPVWGGGTAINMSWSHAATTFREVVDLALSFGLVVYDPQEHQVLRKP